MKRGRNSYLYYLLERHEHDQVLTVIITAYFTFVLILMLLAGIAVWPVMLSGSGSDSVFAPLCRTLLTGNLLLLTVYVLCAAVLLWFDRSFSLVKTALINLGTGGVVNLVLLLSQSGALHSGADADLMLTLLWFVLSFFLAWVLALVPAVLVAAAAKVIHSGFFLLHR